MIESENRIRKLSVSMMCSNLINIEADIKTMERLPVDYLHIDIMDASFVPNLTFGPDMVNSMRKVSQIPFDIHLLMNYPKVIIRSLEFSGEDIVTIHCECKESILENAAFIKQKGAKFGLALNPDTTIEEVKKFLPYVDVILLMLIVPGFSGSSMIHGMMEKVAYTREYLNSNKFDNILISVDGSVSKERAKYLSSVGANIFVGGTAGVFRQNMNISDTITQFVSAL